MKTNLNKTEKSTKKRTYYVIHCVKRVNGVSAECTQIQIYTNLKDTEEAMKELAVTWKEDMKYHEIIVEDKRNFTIKYIFNGKTIYRYYFIKKWTNEREINKFLWRVESLN